MFKEQSHITRIKKLELACVLREALREANSSLRALASIFEARSCNYSVRLCRSQNPYQVFSSIVPGAHAAG